MLAPAPSEANALRNSETWDWRFLAALVGGRSPQRPSISSSAATVRLARSASIASTPRGLLPLSGNDRPSISASTRPRTRISTANSLFPQRPYTPAVARSTGSIARARSLDPPPVPGQHLRQQAATEFAFGFVDQGRA